MSPDPAPARSSDNRGPTGPTVPPPLNRSAAEHEELDPEEVEANTPPGFSLVDKLTQPAPRAGREALELVVAHQGTVQASSLLRDKGERVVLGRRHRNQQIPAGGHKGLPLAKLMGPGNATIRVPARAEGYLEQDDRRISLDQLKTPDRAAGRKADAFNIPVKAGGHLSVSLGETDYHLRFVDLPKITEDPLKLELPTEARYAMGGAVIAHIMAMMFVALTTSQPEFVERAREEYVELQMDEIREVEVEPEPPPPPPPEPEPEPELERPPPPKPKPKPEPKPVRRRRPPPKVAKAENAGPPKGSPEKVVKKAGVLGALGKMNIAAPGKKAMVQAVSNVDAVKTPGGSNYRVGALVGKTPSSQVSVGGGGGGKLLTRGSAELLKGGSGLAKIGTKGGKVRGKVRRVTSRSLQTQGSISREAVLKVINSHINEVQYCYEKNLLQDPSLKGKVNLEWTIASSGRATNVRLKSSTLRSPAVASCIMQSIKRWQFPRPTGGSVIISYPFVFSQSAF
ncbi:MAG: AgmX/PglI C-terminal domain-containing protein [Myxococcota bacterium]